MPSANFLFDNAYIATIFGKFYKKNTPFYETGFPPLSLTLPF